MVQGKGLAMFDGIDWKVYNTSNSGLPDNNVRSIAIDGSGNKWIGTGGLFVQGKGLALFDEIDWKVYNTSNSGLPVNQVPSIAIDGNENKWIGTFGGGLAVYKKGGIVSIERNSTSPKFSPTKYRLGQNFPNPFNPSTKIKFELPKPETVKIEIYNIIGQKIETLLNQPMPEGYHEVTFNAQNLSSGIYLYRVEAGALQDVKKMILLR
jgi:hypothetical protein